MGQVACCAKNSYANFEFSNQHITFNIPGIKAYQIDSCLMQTSLDILKQKMYIDGYQDYSATEFIKTEITVHGLLDTICIAYDKHVPIVLTPDVIWSTITQAVGIHMNLSADKTKLTEKKAVIIKRDDFVREQQADKYYRVAFNWSQMNQTTRRILQTIQDQAEIDDQKKSNNWSNIFPEFTTALQIQSNPALCALLSNDFGTSTVASKIVSAISLGDTLQQPFNYEIKTKCGIPRITLEGTVQDWKKLKKKYEKLVSFNKKHKLEMDFWFKHLTPVIKKICNTCQGKIDVNFWNNMYAQTQQLSGPVRVHGWILTLFPYIHTHNKRDYEVNTKLSWREVAFGIDQKCFPNGLSTVPFIWDHKGKKYNMHLVGGLLGATFDKETGALKPGFGWAVIDN